MNNLALLGGKPIRTKPFPAYNTISQHEEVATLRVLRSGTLSKYLGVWHKDFMGGPEVQAFECEWAEYFKVKHAIAVNSATSGLYTAVGAIGIELGDEVIVSPYTMSASAVAPLIYGGIPVFADIEKEFLCLDPEEVEKHITPKTKAIIVVDIMGLPYDAEAINKLAKKFKLKVIEDTAQAPGAMYGKKSAGTLGDIGVYSLNFHKHIHTGEGGMIVTNDDDLADRCRLIRNHAESVVAGKGTSNINNLVGFNYRMTEIHAAIGREQLKKLPRLLEKRQKNVEYLNKHLNLPCIQPAPVRPNTTHAYYTHPLFFDEKIAGVSRNTFIQAVKAELAPTIGREDEGVMIGCGYVKPLYLLPTFQKKISFGSQGFPWSYTKKKYTYKKGLCPVAEEMHYNKLFTHELMRPPMTKKDLDDVYRAFKKVWDHRNELREQ